MGKSIMFITETWLKRMLLGKCSDSGTSIESRKSPTCS